MFNARHYRHIVFHSSKLYCVSLTPYKFSSELKAAQNTCNGKLCAILHFWTEIVSTLPEVPINNIVYITLIKLVISKFFYVIFTNEYSRCCESLENNLFQVFFFDTNFCVHVLSCSYLFNGNWEPEWYISSRTNYEKMSTVTHQFFGISCFNINCTMFMQIYRQNLFQLQTVPFLFKNIISLEVVWTVFYYASFCNFFF